MRCKIFYLLCGLLTPLTVWSQPFKIDGNLEDWAKLKSTLINTKANAVFQPKNWLSEKDLSVSYRLTSDSENIYAAIQITDDVIVKAKNQAGQLKSDHIELWLDLIPGTERLYVENEKDGKIVKTTDKSRMIQLAFGPDNWVAYYLPEKKPVAPQAIESALITVPGGYVLECRLNGTALGELPANGVKKVGFLVDVVDADNPSQPAQDVLFSSSAKRKFGDPKTFSQMELPILVTPKAIQDKMAKDAAVKAVFKCFPGGFWAWDGANWNFSVRGEQPIFDDGGIFLFQYKFANFQPKFIKSYPFGSGPDQTFVVCSYEDVLAVSAMTSTNAQKLYGSWFDEKTAASFGHLFTKEYSFTTFKYPDGVQGCAVSRLITSRTGTGICGGAETYATTFYRLNQKSLDQVFEFMSSPCDENVYLAWKWTKPGAEIMTFEYPEANLKMDESAAGSKALLKWNGKTFAK